MELSTNAEKIISQADQWTLAGDCSLLQWMEEIAHNLEQRASTTTETLGQLSTNLKRTTTALDNVSNSLAALQYTQFVESRCHDDDETIANVTEVPVDVAYNNPAPEDTNKLWKNFMKQNFKVLHNCHERYALDLLDDSDEEDNLNNFIYQAKNPYNERLLPHIYGSNLWKENWHVGLCDGSNDYSGDEISEAFSESSSITSPEENELSESTASNLSEWASSTSITNEKQPPHLKIQNASSLRGSQPLFPEETIQRVTKIAAGSSDTSSSTSRNTLNQMKTGFVQNQPRYDLFAPIQDIPPTSTTTSSSSSLNQQFSNTAQSNTNKRKDFLDTNVESSPVIGVSAQSNTNQIRRRPVNLFDDDDFNNFMTEIVDKVNQKQEPEPIVPPVPVARKQSSISSSSVIKTKEQEVNTPATEHFSELVQEPAKARPAIEKKEPVKKKTLNLFDDSIDLFPPTTDISATVTKVPPIDLKNDMRTRITAKSLFDDDDEDDDFLNIFASKKPNTTKPIEKTFLFNDDEPKQAEVNFEKSEAIVSKNNLIKSSRIKAVDIFKDTTSLFNDSDEVKEVDEVFDKSPSQIRDNNKISENNSNEQQKINIPEEHENNMPDVHSRGGTPQKIGLFSELSKNESTIAEKPNQVEINTSKKSLLLQKVSLFDDSESDDDNIFGNSVKAKTLLASKQDNLFGDDLLPIISPVKTTEKSEKYDSAVFNKVDTSQGIEQVSEEQRFRDEKIFNMSSNQPIHSSESENVQDKSSNPIEPSRLSKTSLTSANDFQQLGDNVENDFKILVHNQKVQESAPPLVDDKEETSQLVVDDKVQKPSQLPVDDKVQETSQPPIDDKVQETAYPPVDDEVQETLQPPVDKVQETAQPLEDKEAADIVQVLNDESSTVITNIASTIENKIPNTYAGLFLDEPPEDDDAFFQSLDSSALSSSKFSHDLEAEFYEPALPKPPTEVTNPTTSVSTYTSMGLFSDIPPDDDLEDFSFNSNSTRSSEITKRIHSVFYDDFKETIAAVNKKPTEVSPTLHTIFTDEPPSDNDDDFATLLQSASKRKNDTTTDVANDKVVPISQDVLDKAKPNTADHTKNAVENIKVKSSSSVSKLQMPKININVQALLPPSVKKTIRELPTDSTNAEKSDRSKTNNSFTSSQPSACSPTATNANILVNVCKNRVRAPKRRPSTRRARQENYRKSLTAEQDERDNENEAEISTEQKVENLKTSEQGASIQQQHAITEEINTLGISKSFFEINNDNTKASSKIIDTTKTLDKNVVKHEVKAATLYPSESIEKSTITNITSKTGNISKGLFDDFNDDGDEDFLSTKKMHNQSKLKTSLDNKPIKSSVQEELKSKIARQSENISESKKGENKDLPKALFQDDNDTQTVDNLKTSVSKKSSQKEMPAKSLFEDQNESDSDELFGTKKVLQTKNTSNVAKIVETKKAKVIAKATPLFSSDDDAVDDDSKEINKFEKSLKKAVPTKALLTKSTEKAVTKGLFSDTDDDDDLFSSKSATKANFSKAKDKHIKSAKTHLSNQQEKSASISTTPTIKTTDNPLADLLNN